MTTIRPHAFEGSLLLVLVLPPPLYHPHEEKEDGELLGSDIVEGTGPHFLIEAEPEANESLPMSPPE